MTVKSKSTLEVGYLVALNVREGMTPLPCYVGQIQAVDERGVRLTLVDWFVGIMSGADFFASWEIIEAALVYTPDHAAELFLDDASKWQTRMINRTKGVDSPYPIVEGE